MSLLDHLRNALEQVAHEISDDADELHREVMEAVADRLSDAHHELEAFGAELENWALTHPRPIFALLRKLQPILVFKKFALVTRFDHVEEVLARDDVFDVPYADKMRLITNGENFFLGMRNTPRYTRDASNMRIAVRREDLDTFIAPFVDRTSCAIVAESSGSLDIVQGLTRLVPARLVGAYFGTPGPSEQDLIAWTSTLFHFLFLDQANDPELRQRALAASTGLNGYIDATIAERKKKPQNTDDILTRCLAFQRAGLPGMSDLDIRNNFIGLLIGAIPTTATTTALVIDELLKRPSELAAARDAVKADDDARLGKYVFEALRFNPMNPGIFRIANQDYTVAKGTACATTIRAGTTVVAATHSAMFDERRIDDPETFRIDRPNHAYVHWGAGLHTCFGQYINAVQIPKIVKALLLRDNLRRAPGKAGELQKEGPFAGSLSVVFG